MALGLPGKLIISVFPGIGQEILEFGRLMGVRVLCLKQDEECAQATR